MRNDIQPKHLAVMLKLAFEEGYEAARGWHQSQGFEPPCNDKRLGDWNGSTTRTMHDQLLMEAKGGSNVRTVSTHS